VRDFNEAFEKVISQLPNPFVTTEVPNNYRSFYLSYVHESSRNNKEFTTFVQAHEAAITLDDFSNLVSHHFHQEEINSRKIDINRPLLNFASRKIHVALDSKHKRGIAVVIELVNKYNRLAVSCSLDPHSEFVLFKIIHSLISRLDVVAETENISLFLAILEKYITKSHKRYNLETTYRSLLKHLLTQLDKITPVRQRLTG
jgi:hypothetical protein